MATNRFFLPITSLILVLAILFTGLTPAHAAPPSNDDFASATLITEPFPFTDAISTTEATLAIDDPYCYASGQTVWYQFTPTRDMHILANTYGSDYDTTLSVYTGSPGNLNQIACNDDSFQFQSQVVFDAAANQTYFFMVGAYGGFSGGSLIFTVDEFTPFTASLLLNPVGSFDRAGNAIIRGTVTCSRQGDFLLYGDVMQKVGRKTIMGRLDVYLPCNGETPWEAVVSGQNGKFAGGQASVTISGSAYDPILNISYDLSASSTVQLKRK